MAKSVTKIQSAFRGKKARKKVKKMKKKGKSTKAGKAKAKKKKAGAITLIVPSLLF